MLRTKLLNADNVISQLNDKLEFELSKNLLLPKVPVKNAHSDERIAGDNTYKHNANTTVDNQSGSRENIDRVAVSGETTGPPISNGHTYVRRASDSSKRQIPNTTKTTLIRPASMGSSSYVLVEVTALKAYNTALRSFLDAFSRRENTEILESMKAIVKSCRDLTELLDTRAKSVTLSHEENELLKRHKSQLSICLTRLMGAVKSASLAGSKGKPESVNEFMEAAKKHAESLSDTMEILADIYTKYEAIFARSSGNQEEYQLETKDSNLKERDKPPSRPEKTKSTVLSLDVLHEQVKPCSAELYWPEQKKLSAFLETQTGSIVKVIQTILKAMHESQYGEEFDVVILTSETIVGEVVAFCKATLASEPQSSEIGTKVRPLLQSLEESSQRLISLAKEVTVTPESRKLKQGLASASYEVAKYIRDLLFMFDPSRQKPN